MKKKNYEKTTGIIFLLVMLIVIEIIVIVILYNNKIYSYTIIDSLYLDDKNIMTFVNKEERNVLYKNTSLYIDNKKIKYTILKDKGVTLKDNKQEYYEIYLKLKIKGKYKQNDHIKITIQNKKIKLLKIFKLIWDGDVNS